MKRFAIVTTFLALAVFSSMASTRQTREEYVEKYKAIAIAHMVKYGIPASITMAQGILESDSGNSELARKSNNHFGIKCKKTWKGDRVYHDDDAKGECFRAYPSVEESYADHAEFLDKQPRYESLFAYPSDDYRNWAKGLKAAGYATAPDYAERLIAIIEAMHLYKLDVQSGQGDANISTNSDEDINKLWESHKAVSDDQVNPNAYRVTINAYQGYGVYRTNQTYYVIAKEGDTFESLGEVFVVSPKLLRKFNDLPGDAQLSKGEIVYIEPKKSAWLGNTMQHTVVENENLYSLSQSYGIRKKSLARLNKLRADEDFNKGDIIRLK